jgi:hypothetical protein
VPKEIVSDKDSMFNSNFWKGLLMGILSSFGGIFLQ